ncbi:MAG: response regulator, partial [Candidatus Thiodiazotropha weberae]|nr:response regulator [Candidatus Thiodiazotropha weberae]
MTRILLVDDDIASCRTLQLHLSGLGHEVSMAHSVDEGLQLLESFKPGLVVLDIRMPGKSGLQGLPEFKSALPEVRIIMITAFHDMESTIEAMQKGA